MISPEAKHWRRSRSSIADSRKISANAQPKITIVPATLPRIISLRRQIGIASSTPSGSGTIAMPAIQRQLSSVMRLPLLRARAEQDALDASEVPFVTRVLVDSVADAVHREAGGPGRRRHRRVVHRDLIVDRVRVEPREALDEVQCF